MKWRNSANSDLVAFGGIDMEIPIYLPIPHRVLLAITLLIIYSCLTFDWQSFDSQTQTTMVLLTVSDAVTPFCRKPSTHIVMLLQVTSPRSVSNYLVQ